MILKSYKYRIYPNEQQRGLINKTIGCCRLVYNLALETKIRAWESNVSLSAYDLHKQLTDLKREYTWLKEVDSQALIATIVNLEKSYTSFFNGAGFPKFKRKRISGSFQCQSNTRKVDWINSTITIPKIHNIPAILTRRFEGKIKTCTITRTPTHKYYISILVETNCNIINPKPCVNAIGIDLGLKHFGVASTGEKIDNPKYLRKSINRLRILHRRASKKKKGGCNRKKANLKVAILYEKITNQRNDFLHKLSTKLISDKQTDTICVESLAVSNMVRNHKLAQAISDVSWAEFVRQLEYKGKWYGKNVIKINRFYASSKICSDCGHKYDELNLSERSWQCSNCGSNHDRDINAAINIRNSGMGNPGEPSELPAISGTKKKESMPKVGSHTLIN